MDTIFVQTLEYICYDDGCHLKRYADKQQRRDLTATSKLLHNMSIVVDKMHMTGHTDAWCKDNCDPKLYPDLKEVCMQ